MRAETARTQARAGAALSAARRLAARAAGLPAAWVLPALVAAELAVAAGVALTAARNGWLFAGAGYDVPAWAAGWAVGHLEVPAGAPGYGTAALLWPFALASGGSLPAAAPALAIVQAAVLGPLVLLAVYGIAARIGGRLFGYAAAAGWVIAPLLALAYFYPGEREFQGIRYSDYRGIVHDVVLPAALGLAAGPVFPSLAALTGTAWLTLRAAAGAHRRDALLAGLTAGVAVGIDPANALFLPAPLAALVVARRPRQAGLLAAALLPALGTLALWRWSAGGTLAVHWIGWRWETLQQTYVHLRGAGWSLLLLLWIGAAGAFALTRKAPAAGTLIALWCAAFFVGKAGGRGYGDVADGTVLVQLAPAFPAFALLAAGLLLLVPGWGRPRRAVPVEPARAPRRRAPAAAAGALALYPLALVALAAAGGSRAVAQLRDETVPVVAALAPRVEPGGTGTRLSWRAPATSGAAVTYRVYRAAGPGCARGEGAQACAIRMAVVSAGPDTSWVDPAGDGRWYRVAALADRPGDRAGARLLMISPATPPP